MATFNFNCPQCKKYLSAEDEWRGLTTECPHCHQTITIPFNSKQNSSKIEKRPTKVKAVLTTLPWKWIIILTIFTLSIVFYLTQCSSEAQHRKRVKKLNGFVVLNKAVLASPSDKINFNYYEKYKLIS